MAVARVREAAVETPPDRTGRDDPRCREMPVARGFDHTECRSSVGP